MIKTVEVVMSVNESDIYPTKRAEVITRCRDCKHGNEWISGRIVCKLRSMWFSVEPNGFCNYGKPREDVEP